VSDYDAGAIAPDASARTPAGWRARPPSPPRPYFDLADAVSSATVGREEKGLSQLALAKRADVAQAYISEMEAGQKKNPGIETLRKIAKALGVPVTELLE